MGGTYGCLGVSPVKAPGISLEDRGFLENQTLPETNSSPLKIDPWKRRFLLKTAIFMGYVSFREGNFW